MFTTTAANPLRFRDARESDLAAIRAIYNQGIEDRTATLDEHPKSDEDIRAWFGERGGRYAVVLAERDGRVAGWASLNPYSHRCAYRGIADLSVYVERAARGTGVGTALLRKIATRAKSAQFHKIVLFALTQNAVGLHLYRSLGYREVGTFREHGRLDGRYVDVVAMEKILKPFILFVCKHNTGRSQMAEAFLRNLVGERVDVASAGTLAADRADPGVVAAMAEIGIDISGARPKLIDPAEIDRADEIITMGCDVEGVPRVDDDWALPDPKGQSPERVRQIRDLVRQKAAELAERLGSAINLTVPGS
jgi:phosphinothricin acetyltransferase